MAARKPEETRDERPYGRTSLLGCALGVLALGGCENGASTLGLNDGGSALDLFDVGLSQLLSSAPSICSRTSSGRISSRLSSTLMMCQPKRVWTGS